MKYVLLAVVALMLFVLIRTLLFRPIKTQQKEYEEIEIDKEKAIEALGELVRCKTVSNRDSSKEDDKEFEKLINKLPKLYPNVFKTMELKRFDGRGLLFHWKGRENGKPAVFMAHYDVVPAQEDAWSHPAFEAEIVDGIMWGRGTLDTKSTFNGVLFAGETLIKQGFVPRNDIYFAFSGGEEIGGIGAKEIVKYFKENNIELEMVVDEGGAVVSGIFPGVTQPCGLVGIAEKGMMDVIFEAKSNGGHASAPGPHTPVGYLSKACVNVENHPFKMHIKGPAGQMFDTLGRYSTFVYRMIFANMWLFGPVFDRICRKSGGDINAIVRTTVAYTQMEGSPAPNVIPVTARMVANLRLNPEDRIDSALAYLKKQVNNPDIKLSLLDGDEPSRVSRTDVLGYKIVKEAIEGTWKGSIVSPYLMIQCSDSKHYGEISDRVYRFSAMDLTAEERKTIHGNDEHIRLETIGRTVEFFIRCMKEC